MSSGENDSLKEISLEWHYCPNCQQLFHSDDELARHYLESPVCVKALQEPVESSKQARIDQAWVYSKAPGVTELILPIAKSSYYQKRQIPRVETPKPRGGFHAVEDKQEQVWDLSDSQFLNKGASEVGGSPQDQELPQVLGLEQGRKLDHSILERFYELKPPLGWFLPGHGESYPTCGTPNAWKCENKEAHPEKKVFVRYGIHSCMRKECPVCREAWGASEAERALVRFATFGSFPGIVRKIIARAKIESKGQSPREFHRILCEALEIQIKKSWRGPPTHLMVSPPQDSSFLKADYANLRKRAQEIARSAGLWAGSIIFHSYRLHCRLCGSMIPDYQEVCPKCGHDMKTWQIGHHFHMVGYGWIKNGADIYSKTNWVVKNLGFRTSVFWTFQYLLSHAGVFKDPELGVHKKTSFHVVTWFGGLSYNKLKEVPKVESPKQVCPHCGNFLKFMEDEELGRRPPPENWREESDILLDGG